MAIGTCWMCGKKGSKKQNHHAIPKRYNPKNNITIPLCKGCHKKLHEFDQPVNNGRQKVVFTPGKSKDGKINKLIGRTYDGCICFPDKSEKVKITPNKEYYANIYKIGHTAFARQIEELNEG